MVFDARTVLARLAELRELDRGLSLFGAEEHRYILHERLGEPAVMEFERKHEALLPADYRQFLLEIGNGGAGPAYGVFKLGEMDDGWKMRRWSEGDDFIGDLSAPFPHARRWNKLPKMPKVREEDPSFEGLMEQRDREYWSASNVHGAIPICHLGCCLRHWLVVTGREAGNVWIDRRADEAGLSPFSSIWKRRYAFSDWYNKWLADSLRAAKRRRRR